MGFLSGCQVADVLMSGPCSDRAEPAVVRVGAATVVPTLDVFHHRGARTEVVGELLLVEHLGLQMREEILGDGIVPAHPDLAHGLSDSVRLTPVLELRRGVLSTSV